MANALEQLRYIDEQLVTFALTPDQAELVRVHRLMGLQLRGARLQELPSAPSTHGSDYQQWQRCRKDAENEVEMSLAETRLSVEGLEESWERWLHLEKLKTIREQLLEQTSNEGLLQDSQLMQTSQHIDSKDNLGVQEGSWQGMQGNPGEAQEWDPHQQSQYHQSHEEYHQSHGQGGPNYSQAEDHQPQFHYREQNEQAHLRDDDGGHTQDTNQHHAHQMQPPEENQNGANPGQQSEGFPETQLQLQQEQWSDTISHEQELEDQNVGAMPQSVQMKLCRRCNTHKPVTQFYKSKANADGYDGRCKTCDAVQCAQRRRRKERVENPTVEWKACRRCGMNKPANEFYRNKTNGDGLYNNCKICFSHDAASRRERLPPLEERTATAKKCRRCKETKPASDFYKNKHMSDGLYTHCKACYTEAANLRSAGRAPAETKRCRRCSQTKEASEFYISKMTADGLQSYCKACYAVASAARRSRSNTDHMSRSKEMEEYVAQAHANQHMQDHHLLQSQLDQLHHHQVLGVPHMAMSSTIHPNQLQQLGYDPSMMQAGLDDQGLGHQGLDPQVLDQSHQFDHPGHHMLDAQASHMLDASLAHPGHHLEAVHHLGHHSGLDQQVLEHHALGHHPDEVYAHLDHDGSLLHAHGVPHLQMHPSQYQEEGLQG